MIGTQAWESFALSPDKVESSYWSLGECCKDSRKCYTLLIGCIIPEVNAPLDLPKQNLKLPSKLFKQIHILGKKKYQQ